LPPHLFCDLQRILDDPLDALEFWTHVLTGPHRRDGICERGRFVGICKQAVLDGISPLFFSIFLELIMPSEARH
jgi:hypothetical protein